jgi:mono/diheme cytochrome c family protein
MGRIKGAVVCTALLALVAFGTVPAMAQTVKRVPAQPTEGVDGVTTFRAYCASCHGVSGKGDGPAAKALKQAPADLTTISKRHGRFSRADIEAVIMGEQTSLSTMTMPAHGSREMPIWGFVFRQTDSPDMTKLRVSNLIDYLESIQAK